MSRRLRRRCAREEKNLWGFAPDPRIYRFPAKIDLDRGSERTPLPINPGPGVGARVASLRGAILRPGHPRVLLN
jgi:hypothetical protein